MREIKFRIWDKKRKEWVIKEMNLIGEISVIAGGLTTLLFPYGIMELNDLEASQYTGLKDKNGKEIYERDIVFCSFIDGTGIKSVIEYDDKNACFFVKDENGVNTGLWEDYYKCFEIIGNIYENPALLEVKELK